MLGNALDDRHEHRVDEDILVLGMTDDVGDLLGEQARVDGMGHVAGAADAVVGLEVAVVVGDCEY